MELFVTISLSDRLFELLEDKLPNLGKRIERSVGREAKAAVLGESGVKVSVSPVIPASAPGSMVADPDAVEAPKPIAVTVEAMPEAAVPEAAPVAAVEESPASEAPRMPTLEDCRAALHRTRVRFEGEDYENKTSEGYAKYHKAISAQIKQIVMQVSGGRAEKIPGLPEDCRAAFIAECDALIIDDNGNIAPKLPF